MIQYVKQLRDLGRTVKVSEIFRDRCGLSHGGAF